MACSKKESNLFKDHISYFQLIGLENYSNFDMIVIVDSQGCKSCEISALDLIEKISLNQTIKVIDLGLASSSQTKNEVFIDSSRIYYTFPFSFDGLTVVDINSEKVFYPLFKSTFEIP